MTRSIWLGRRRWRWAIEPPTEMRHARPRRLAYLVIMWRSFLWLPLVSTCAHAPDGPGPTNKPEPEPTAQPTPAKSCELVTDREQLAACVGKTVTLRGVVSRSKIPSILGVDVDAAYSLSDQVGVATGTLGTYTIRERGPDEPIVASKGPGTYYSLAALDGNGLAKASAAE